jgi:hypothetical protein
VTPTEQERNMTVRLSVVSQQLTNGSKVWKMWNVRFGDMQFHAITEKDAYELADKFSAAVREHTVDATVTA